MVKHLPTMEETRVRSLGWEDPLEKEMATHSSILAWRIPWKAESGGLQSMGGKESDTTEQLMTLRMCKRQRLATEECCRKTKHAIKNKSYFLV